MPLCKGGLQLKPLWCHVQTAFTPVPNPEEGFSGVVDTLHGGLEVPKQERAGPAEPAQGA